VRAERLYWLVASLTIAGASAACAAVAGLNRFSTDDGTDDGGPPPDDDVGAPDASGDVTTTGGPDGASGEAGEIGQEAGDDESGAGPDGAVDAARRDAQATADASDGSSPVDAGDDGSTDDAEVKDAACTQVTHLNGINGTYKSCAPLGTYGPDEATAACTSAHVGTCGTQMIICGIADTETLECAQTSTNCTCWTYEMPNIGRARLSALGAACQCPVATDLLWQ
jgi:hypothetical protein